MPCSTSSNQTEFTAEVCFHVADASANWDNPAVFVLPRILVCLDCGASSPMTPASQLAKLCAAD